MIRLAFAALVLMLGAGAAAREPAGLGDALDRLAREGKFSGAVVVRDADGVRFARGYGLADPFAGRRFTPDTPVDSGSLAKPATAAAVLALAQDKKLKLDEPVRRYLPYYPDERTTVRNLLAHSAGLVGPQDEKSIVGKNNAQLVAGLAGRPLLFPPGSAFAYCNYCYVALADLIERVSGRPYIDFVRERAGVPAGVTLRPASLANWAGRAIGYGRTPDGAFMRADSYEDERFYGSANLSISASQLAQWGAQSWNPRLAELWLDATRPALIDGKALGLSQGNWYCADDRRRCHYLGHHEGFHHMLYWDRDRRLSIAMVTNNSLAPALQQRLQRALVAFAEGRKSSGKRELGLPLSDEPIRPGVYQTPAGMASFVAGSAPAVSRNGLKYPAYRISTGIHYVPGLDVYLAGAPDGNLRWLGLHDDLICRRDPQI